VEGRFAWSRGSWTPKLVGQREFLIFFFHRIALKGVQLEVNKIYQD